MIWAKRASDVCGAVGGLLFFAPVMLAVTVAILLDDGRPVLFRQIRLGRGRRTFEILKFRSMRDARVTRVGRLLRATGLDELPQFVIYTHVLDKGPLGVRSPARSALMVVRREPRRVSAALFWLGVRKGPACAAVTGESLGQHRITPTGSSPAARVTAVRGVRRPC